VDTGRRGDRAGQRNIDARGERQAKALGDAFRVLNIPITAVSASEVFRAKETAQIAFGAARVRILDVLIADDYTPRDASADAQVMRRILGQPPVTGNAVFVGHIIRIELIGIVSAEALIRAAGLETPWAR
jgi:phosphohistidine phosphatase SixA